MARPYELKKAILEGDKIQGLHARENAYHQMTPILDFFLVNSGIPNSQIRPNFDFILDNILLFSPTAQNPIETIVLDVFSPDNIRLYTQTLSLPSNNLHFTDFPKIPFSRGSRLTLSYQGTANDTITARLCLRRVWLHEI